MGLIKAAIGAVGVNHVDCNLLLKSGKKSLGFGRERVALRTRNIHASDAARQNRHADKRKARTADDTQRKQRGTHAPKQPT